MARILAVEEEPSQAMCVHHALEGLGHEVTVANSAEQLENFLQAETYDLALVGDQLAAGPQAGVLSQLREQQPGCVRVLMTERSDPGLLLQAINQGGVRQIVSRASPLEQLRGVVQHLLEQAVVEQASLRKKKEIADAKRMIGECFDEKKLALAVQPILSIDGQTVRAVECLLRSQHAVLKFPDKLIHAAELADQIEQLGEEVNWMAAGWARVLPADIQVFVNVHPRQFSDPKLEERFRPLFPFAHRVVLEITEREHLEGAGPWKDALQWLTRRGFSLAIDDLGSGANGLAMMADLRPPIIKVDMSVVRDVDQSPHRQEIIKFLAGFARSTDASLVAEGVETRAEFEAVAACGAQLVQGYYFARPSLQWGAFQPAR